MLSALLAQMPSHELLARVSTDGAYDTKGCHAAIAQRSAQAVIPRKRTVNREKRPGWEQQCAMQRCEPAKGWGGGSGRNGVVFTEEA